MGLLSHNKKDSEHSSPVHKLNGVVKFKTKEADARTSGHFNGDVATGNNSEVKVKVHSNGTGVQPNDRSVNHGNQLSHVGSERRKWFVAKSSKSLGRWNKLL